MARSLVIISLTEGNKIENKNKGLLKDKYEIHGSTGIDLCVEFEGPFPVASLANLYCWLDHFCHFEN